MAVLSATPLAVLPTRATRNVSRRSLRRSAVMSSEETPASEPVPKVGDEVDLLYYFAVPFSRREGDFQRNAGCAGEARILNLGALNF